MSSASPQFRGYDDYYVPLLRLLAALPGGKGRTREVQDEFWRCHQLRIPPEHRVIIRDGKEEKWRNVLDWSRNGLKKRGLLDMPQFGFWRISQAGQDWLSQNPDATHLGDPPQTSMPAAPAKEPRTPTPRAAVAVPAGITLDKLERIRKVMSADEFRHDWGEIYEQLLAAERARAITPLNDRYLLERIRPLVQRIQDFLQGRGNESPKSEVICDWIFICYTLEMFREGAALWRYVNKDEVNTWQYERTAKYSTACRTRVGS